MKKEKIYLNETLSKAIRESCTKADFMDVAELTNYSASTIQKIIYMERPIIKAHAYVVDLLIEKGINRSRAQIMDLLPFSNENDVVKQWVKNFSQGVVKHPPFKRN